MENAEVKRLITPKNYHEFKGKSGRQISLELGCHKNQVYTRMAEVRAIINGQKGFADSEFHHRVAFKKVNLKRAFGKWADVEPVRNQDCMYRCIL